MTRMDADFKKIFIFNKKEIILKSASIRVIRV